MFFSIKPKLDNHLFVGFGVFNNTVNSQFKKPDFSFLKNRELFDLRKIYVLILKTCHSKKMYYVGEFAI